MSSDRRPLGIFALGRQSSRFAVALCEDLKRLGGARQVGLVGVYDASDSDDRWRKAINKLCLRRRNVTPSSKQRRRVERLRQRPVDVDAYHIATMRDELVRRDGVAEHRLRTLVWITDGGRDAERSATIMDDLKHELDCDSVMLVCFRPAAAPMVDRTPYGQFRQLAMPDPDRETPYSQVTLLLSPHSSLTHALGPDYQQALVSRTLAAMLLAGTPGDSSPSFASVVGTFNEQRLPFATFALDSSGLQGDEQERWYRRAIRLILHPHSHPPFRYETIYQRCMETTKKLIEGQEGTTSPERLDRQRSPMFVSYLIPMRRRDRRIMTLRAAVSAYLSAEYRTPPPVFVCADGIDVSRVRLHSRGDYYCQTGVLYGFDAIAPEVPVS